ncbi:MAG TPA: hypothetical protein ENH80_06650 [Phycisphaerae bacterium]|nr:hypothetical protein [Phycisphaerae bacterium]HDZ43603.1 hypothetical protein [Phycisphaerae bacterium]
MMIAIAFMFLGGCVSDEPRLRMGEERVIFMGTVEKVEPLGRRKATVYPVGVNPLFLLVVKVNAVEKNQHSPIAGDESINFAIHSPSRLLGTEDPIGREFRFKATWVFGPERPKRFSWLQARPGTAGDK